MNGDVYDKYVIYGEENVLCGRIVDGVTIPVVEGLCMEWSEEEDLDEEDY